jgi:Protein of unknown function (DUF3108)
MPESRLNAAATGPAMLPSTRARMRLLLVALASGLVASLSHTAAPAAAATAAAPLAPFQASYTWIWHGAAIAVSTVKLEQRRDDIWVYSSNSEPRGLGNLYPMRPKLQSVMRVSDQGVQPLSYHATDGTSANQRGADVSFDWDAGHASGVYEGVKVDLALKSGVQDDLSIQIALLYALRRGQVPDNLSMIDKNTFREYSYQREGEQTIDSKLGRIATVVYASHHEGSPRTTRFWCAPAKGYVPVRVEQKRLDSVEWTMEIETLKGG